MSLNWILMGLTILSVLSFALAFRGVRQVRRMQSEPQVIPRCRYGLSWLGVLIGSAAVQVPLILYGYSDILQTLAGMALIPGHVASYYAVWGAVMVFYVMSVVASPVVFVWKAIGAWRTARRQNGCSSYAQQYDLSVQLTGIGRSSDFAQSSALDRAKNLAQPTSFSRSEGLRLPGA